MQETVTVTDNKHIKM